VVVVVLVLVLARVDGDGDPSERISSGCSQGSSADLKDIRAKVVLR
jgi:hypothetical protein